MSKPGEKRVVFACLANCLSRKESVERVKDEKADPGSKIASILSDNLEGASISGMDQARVSHTKRWLETMSTFVNLDPLSSLDSLMQDSCCSCDCAGEHYSVRTGNNAVKTGDEICSCGERRSTGNGCCCCACQQFSNDGMGFRVMENKLDNQFSCSAVGMNTKSQQLCSGQQHPRNRLSLQVVDSNNAEQMSTASNSSASVSLATELVTLDMNVHHHLGITVVGHSIKTLGDCGIFVGCVKRGGAAAISGRIEPGDLILEVNGIDLESLSNEQAVRTLREELAKGGIIQLLMVKCWNFKAENIENAVKEQLCEQIETLEPSKPSKFCIQSPAARRTSNQSAKSLRCRQFNEGSGRSENEVKVVHSPSYISPSSRVAPSLAPCLKNASYISSSTPIQNNGLDSALHKLQLSDILSFSGTCGSSAIHGYRTNCHWMNQSCPFLGSDFLKWIQSHNERHFTQKSAMIYADWLLHTGHIVNADFCENRNFSENLYYKLSSQMQQVR